MQVLCTRLLIQLARTDVHLHRCFREWSLRISGDLVRKPSKWKNPTPSYLWSERRFLSPRDSDGSRLATADLIHQAQFALDVKAKVIPLYEQVFDIEYPLPKLDTLVASDFDLGAMENWVRFSRGIQKLA